jgi:N-acetylmuramoyl-L-alanine amidase
MSRSRLGAVARSAVLLGAVLCGGCGGRAIAGGAQPSATSPVVAVTSSPSAPSSTMPSRGARVPRPSIRQQRIPLTEQRRRETVAYAERHYGLHRWTIAHPHVIVEHLTENDSVEATWNAFAPDVPDVELHELPGVCSQFVIARSGAIYQLTPVTFMCRHTVGLNWAAIGIEHVGYREDDVFARRAQLDASLRLTRWLRCRYGIQVRDVVGHAESLSSPFHRERIASLRTQTHSDWQPWAMRRYRTLLRARGACPHAAASRR